MTDYIYKKVQFLLDKYGTNDPFQILREMKVVIIESDRFTKLKGFIFQSCRTIYVTINESLPIFLKHLVAAHELGHIMLHKDRLKIAPMSELQIGCTKDVTEREANLFAAELLISDDDVFKILHDFSEENNSYPYSEILKELLSFKLYSLKKRGQDIPVFPELNNTFLRT